MEQQTIKIRKLVRENRLSCQKNENDHELFKPCQALLFLTYFIFAVFRRDFGSNFREKRKKIPSHLTEREVRRGDSKYNKR